MSGLLLEKNRSSEVAYLQHFQGPDWCILIKPLLGILRTEMDSSACPTKSLGVFQNLLVYRLLFYDWPEGIINLSLDKISPVEL